VRLVCGLALVGMLGGCFDGSSHDDDSDTPPPVTTTPTDPAPPDTSTPAQCTTMHCAPAPWGGIVRFLFRPLGRW